MHLTRRSHLLGNHFYSFSSEFSVVSVAYGRLLSWYIVWCIASVFPCKYHLFSLYVFSSWHALLLARPLSLWRNAGGLLSFGIVFWFVWGIHIAPGVSTRRSLRDIRFLSCFPEYLPPASRGTLSSYYIRRFCTAQTLLMVSCYL